MMVVSKRFKARSLPQVAIPYFLRRHHTFQKYLSDNITINIVVTMDQLLSLG